MISRKTVTLAGSAAGVLALAGVVTGLVLSGGSTPPAHTVKQQPAAVVVSDTSTVSSSAAVSSSPASTPASSPASSVSASTVDTVTNTPSDPPASPASSPADNGTLINQGPGTSSDGVLRPPPATAVYSSSAPQPLPSSRDALPPGWAPDPTPTPSNS